MKRLAITLEAIAALDNLLHAVYRAARGKRTRPDVQCFLAHCDDRVQQLAEAIRAGQVPDGRYQCFRIRDPKPRLIHAACFEDRVLHHALMALAGPVLERALTPTTFACRRGMGHHAAVQQVQRYLQRFPWYVKIDIQHYFDTIDHARLEGLLQRLCKGRDVSALLHRIIASYHVTPGRGLPIGTLTSQYFANLYLDGLDRYLLESLRVSAQVRYMDDIIWWCPSQAQARVTLAQACAWVRTQRGLTVKPSTQINRSVHGVSFCGYRITQGQLRLSRRRQRRYRLLRQRWERAYTEGNIDALTLQRAYAAVHAITLPAESRSWRQRHLALHPPLDL